MQIFSDFIKSILLQDEKLSNDDGQAYEFSFI